MDIWCCVDGYICNNNQFKDYTNNNYSNNKFEGYSNKYLQSTDYTIYIYIILPHSTEQKSVPKNCMFINLKKQAMGGCACII